jgi:alkylation response protein AidB-like acyl-CoA dehydrogenase
VLAQAGAPLPLSDIGINLVGPAIMQFGTEEQKRQHLPGIIDGSATWVQLFSEPEAGSDLASLRTRATPAPDGGWTVNGQKVWSTYGHIADWGYLIARTGDADQRHRTLTTFLVPMQTPGITVRPIREITGDEDFNEVFLDDVRLPADAALGEINRGWAVTLSTLSEERRVTGRLVVGLEAEVDRLARALNEIGAEADSEHRARLAEIVVDVEALALLVESETEVPGIDSLGKVTFSELNIAVHQLAMEVAAAYPDRVPDGWAERWADNYLYTRAYTVSGGANEVLRNVVAKRALGIGGTR